MNKRIVLPGLKNGTRYAMGSFKETFKSRHTFLPVIHVTDIDQALRNTKIAMDSGADGVFLINHHMRWQRLLRIYAEVRRKVPATWIGLNCLDLGQAAISFVPADTAGIWVDNAGVQSGVSQQRAEDFARKRTTSPWRGLYFGGVAFKYQALVSDVAAAAKAAIPFVDVITTSGEGTGSAPSVEKISVMKRAVGEHPLAIASGMTPDNIRQYLIADCFLVATGISGSYHELDPVKVKRFARLLGK